MLPIKNYYYSIMRPLHKVKNKSLIEISNLEITFDQIKVIDQVSLAFQTADQVALIGANGAGKTTLLRTLSGLKSASHGSAHWNQHDLFSVKPEFNVRHGIAHVGEGKSVIAELSVEDNLHLGAIWRKNKKEMKSTQLDVIEIFPILGERIKQRADTLSGGERQRISIARALLINPKILILDEATASVDTETEKEIQKALDNLVRGRTTVAIAHRLSTLHKANRLVVLDQGEIVEIGNHDELMAKQGAYYRLYQAQARNVDQDLNDIKPDNPMIHKATP